MVKGALTVLLVSELSGIVALNVPLATSAPVSVVVPVAVKAVLDMATVALMLSVAFEVAACATAQSNKVVRTSRIDLLLLESPIVRHRLVRVSQCRRGLLEKA
jgi:hypothetical protein